MVKSALSNIESELLASRSRLAIYGPHDIFIDDLDVEPAEISAEAMSAKLMADLMWLFYLLNDRSGVDISCIQQDIARPFALLLAHLEAGEIDFFKSAESVEETFLAMLSWIELGATEEARANSAFGDTLDIAPEDPEEPEPTIPIISQNEIDALLQCDEEIKLSNDELLFAINNIFIDDESRNVILICGDAAASFLLLDMILDTVDLHETLDYKVQLNTRLTLFCLGHLLVCINDLAIDQMDRQNETEFKKSLFTKALKKLSDEGFVRREAIR